MVQLEENNQPVGMHYCYNCDNEFTVMDVHDDYQEAYFCPQCGTDLEEEDDDFDELDEDDDEGFDD